MFKLNKIPLTILFVHILFLSSCDIVDSIFGDDSIESDYKDPQISRVEVDYFIDNANFKLENYIWGNGVPQFVYTNGAEHNGNFITIEPGVFDEGSFESTWEGNVVLGQAIIGQMAIEFLDNPKRVNVHIHQTKTWNSFIVGNVTHHFQADYSGVPFNKSYTDDFYEDRVDEYYESGASVSKIVATFNEANDQYYDELTTYTCGARAFIKVKVHYK